MHPAPDIKPKLLSPTL